jgi:hypothetical protein
MGNGSGNGSGSKSGSNSGAGYALAPVGATSQ